MACLSHLFTMAVQANKIKDNPFKRGKSVWLKEPTMRLRFLNEDEINRLLNLCPRYLQNIVLCALNTGMRKGEILNLRWDQIKDGFIHLEAKDTKTKIARQIPINKTLDALFKNIRNEHGLKSKYVFLYDGDIIEIKSKTKRKGKMEPHRVSGVITSNFF